MTGDRAPPAYAAVTYTSACSGGGLLTYSPIMLAMQAKAVSPRTPALCSPCTWDHEAVETIFKDGALGFLV